MALVSIPMVWVAIRTLIVPKQAEGDNGGDQAVPDWSGVVQRQVEVANGAKALVPLSTAETYIARSRSGLPFHVAVAQPSAFKSKPHAKPLASRPPRDAFASLEDVLIVADSLPEHVVILNKFPVLPGHLVVVARDFQPQSIPLTRADFGAWLSCLGSVSSGLGFYNSGPAAGASQPRKHLQAISLSDLSNASPSNVDQEGPVPPIPLQAAVERALPQLSPPAAAPASGAGSADATSTLPEFDQAGIAHAVARLPASVQAVMAAPGASASALSDAATVAQDVYRRLLRSAEVRGVPPPGAPEAVWMDPNAVADHNVVLTPTWMMVVARRVPMDAATHLGANALGFAGLFLIKSHQRDALREVDPVTVLARCAAVRS